MLKRLVLALPIAAMLVTAGYAAVRTLEVPAYGIESPIHFRKALELRPGSPYLWAALLEAEYRMGVSGPNLEAAIERASGLGPWEPQVQRFVTDFGLAVWDEVSPRARKAIESMVANGMRRNPLEILQISERRGRLNIACRYVSEVPRAPAATWSKFCQSTEATP